MQVLSIYIVSLIASFCTYLHNRRARCYDAVMKKSSKPDQIEEVKYRLLVNEIALAEAEGRFVAKPHWRKAYKELKKLRKADDRDL